MVDYLNRQIPDKTFKLKILADKDMNDAVSRQAIDFLITSPSLYLYYREKQTMGNMLATVTLLTAQHELAQFGGVIFALKARHDLIQPRDIAEQTIAVADMTAFAAYWAPIYELVQAGIDVRYQAKLMNLQSTQDAVVRAVLDGQADVGFVRSGELEKLAEKGKLNMEQLKILNRQDIKDFPFVLSTRLYPEWPVISIKPFDAAFIRQMTVALLMFRPDHISASTHIGFSVPTDYHEVENVLRSLRAPPYDQVPEFSLTDVLLRYRWFWLAAVWAGGVMIFLLVKLWISNNALAVASRQIESSEAKLSALVNSVGSYIYIKDDQYRYQFGNRMVCELFNTSPENLIGRKDSEFFNTDSLDNVLEIDRKVIEEGLTYETIETHIIKSDGSYRDYFSVKTPIRDAAGRITGLCGISTDVTEQTATKNLITTLENRFSKIASRLPGVIYQVEFHPDGSIPVSYISENVTQLFGLPVEAFENGFGAAFALTHPDDYSGLMNSVYGSVKTLKPWVHEYRIHRPDGAIRWLRGSALLERDDDGVVSSYGFINDITEYKAEQEATQELQIRLSRVALRVPGIIFQMDKCPNGLITMPYASAGLSVILDDLRPEDLRDDAAPFFRHCHPDDSSQLIETLNNALQTLRPWFHEFRISRSDGEIRWLRGSAIPEIQNGGIITAYGFLTDITEQQMAQIAINELQERISKIAERLPGVIYQLELYPDGHTRIPFASQGVEGLFGASFSALHNQADAAFALVHPEDRGELFSSLQRAGDNLQAWVHQYRVLWPNGSIRWLRTNATPNQTEDDVILWHGYVSDVTEELLVEGRLRESEDKLRSLYQLSPLGIALTDMAGHFIEFNQAFQKLLGYDDKELKALDYWDVTPIEYETQETAQLDSITRTGGYGPYEKEYIRKDGNRVPVRLNGVMIQGRDGEYHLWSIIEDMTEARAVLDEVRRSNAELEQFAYAVSHDMRQPLRMVSSYLQIIARSLANEHDEDIQTYIRYTIDGAKRMEKMILSLLDYSRIGRATDSMALLDSKTALDEALFFLGPDISAKNGQIEVLGEWPSIMASHDEMTRLFQNLIGNALKYHPEDKPAQVVIEGFVRGSTFRAEVRDNGIGIDPTQIDRLFHVFSRLQSRVRYEGVGVGLALCRKIVEHHGGNIGVTSEGEGLGSTFWFEIPIIAT